MSTTASDAPPALFNHALRTYNAMFEESTLVEQGENIEPLCVYEGKLTELITNKLYLSVPYYTSVTGLLKKMGCIRQLRRGGGSAPSQWELIKSPEIEDFLELQEKDPDSTRTNSPRQKYVTLEEFERSEQRVRDLRKMLLEHDKVIERIIDVIQADGEQERNND